MSEKKIRKTTTGLTPSMRNDAIKDDGSPHELNKENTPLASMQSRQASTPQSTRKTRAVLELVNVDNLSSDDSEEETKQSVSTPYAAARVRRPKRCKSVGRKEEEADDSSTKVLPGSQSKDIYVTCKRCQQRINSTDKRYLVQHARTHSSTKRFGCPFNACVHEKDAAREMRKHLETEHEDSTSAPIDRRSPEMEREWVDVMKTCFPPLTLLRRWTMECTMCTKKIDTRFRMRHVQQVHASLKRFECPHCSIRCHESRNMRIHMKRRHGNTTTPLIDRRSHEMEKEWKTLKAVCFPDNDCVPRGATKRGKRETRGMKSREDENDEEDDEESNESEEEEESEENDEIYDVDDGVGEMMIPSADVSQAGNDMRMGRLPALICDVVKIFLSSSHFNEDENNKTKLNAFVSSMISLCGTLPISFVGGRGEKEDDSIVPSNHSIDYYCALASHELTFTSIGSMIKDPAALCTDLKGRFGRRGSIFLLGLRVIFYCECGWTEMIYLLFCMAEAVDEDWISIDECRRSLEEKQQREWNEEAVKEVSNVFCRIGLFPIVKRVILRAENIAKSSLRD